VAIKRLFKLTKLVINWPFKLIAHLTSVSALPGETDQV